MKKNDGWEFIRTQFYLRQNIKRAHRNMMAQRRKEIAAKHTKQDIRVPSSYWEQVKRDYAKQLSNLLYK